MDLLSFWLGYVLGSTVGSVSAAATRLRVPASPEEQQEAGRRRRFWWLVLFTTLTVLVGFSVWAFVYLWLG
jgi:hypothetical protein